MGARNKRINAFQSIITGIKRVNAFQYIINATKTFQCVAIHHNKNTAYIIKRLEAQLSVEKLFIYHEQTYDIIFVKTYFIQLKLIIFFIYQANTRKKIKYLSVLKILIDFCEYEINIEQFITEMYKMSDLCQFENKSQMIINYNITWLNR